MQSRRSTVAAHARRRPKRGACGFAERKLKLLDPAAKIDDLAAARVNRLELLKGDQAGRHSIRVNDQYRVMFRWENGNAYEARVEDYH
jgi:toxin HigB-1